MWSIKACRSIFVEGKKESRLYVKNDMKMSGLKVEWAQDREMWGDLLEWETTNQCKHGMVAQNGNTCRKMMIIGQKKSLMNCPELTRFFILNQLKSVAVNGTDGVK